MKVGSIDAPSFMACCMASSHVNKSSVISAKTGGYRGPEVSPPPATRGYIHTDCGGVERSFLLMNSWDATSMVAAPSARRAHSRIVVDGAMGWACSTSCKEWGLRVRA